jgi:hypothetical protein
MQLIASLIVALCVVTMSARGVVAKTVMEAATEKGYFTAQGERGVTHLGARATILDLGFIKLTGTIPRELAQLTNVKQLFMSQNKLSGTYPSELGEMTKLTDLILSFNQLTGTLPGVALGKLTNVSYLDLGANQFTGMVPKELGSMENLKFLKLNVNRLTGPIPGASFPNIEKFDFCDFSMNGLCIDNTGASKKVAKKCRSKNAPMCVPFQTPVVSNQCDTGIMRGEEAVTGSCITKKRCNDEGRLAVDTCNQPGQRYDICCFN